MGVDDQARDLVSLVGDDQVLQEGLERQVGQDVARHAPLLGPNQGKIILRQGGSAPVGEHHQQRIGAWDWSGNLQAGLCAWK